MDRDKELVDQAKELLPEDSTLVGDWFLFRREGHLPFIEQVIDGFVEGDGASLDWYKQSGWQVDRLEIKLTKR